MYAVELEEGRADPLPYWVEWFALADVLGCPVPDLPAVEPFLVNAARAMLAARRTVQEHHEAEAARKR